MVPFAVVKDNIFVTKSFVDQKRFFSVPLGDGQTAVGLVHFLRDRSKEVLFLYLVAWEGILVSVQNILVIIHD